MKFVESINSALFDLLAEDNDVILYGEDLLDPYGGAFKVTKGLSTRFPEQVFSTPISEAAIIGMAGGMSIGGIKPIVEIMFGDFLGLGIDQILNHLVKYEWMYNKKVKPAVTIRTAMGGRRGYGPTHSQSVEPILSSIPQLNIFSPTIYHDPGRILYQIVSSNRGISVFSENKLNYPKNLVDEKNIKDGLSIERSNTGGDTVYLSNMEFETPDIIFISHGGNALILEDILLDLLMEYEISAQANLPSRIKPIDFNEIARGVSDSKCVITLEESPKTFGWGGEIISLLAEKGLTQDRFIARIGADESPIPSSSYLESKILPNKSDIFNAIKGAGMI